MTVLWYNTWNPLLQAEVLDGVFPSELLLPRTLEFEYIDRMSQFDNIVWKLDNRDGVLTRPENLAAGLLIRIRLGYNEAEMPWRTMVINRVKGGLGVYGRGEAAVGSAESSIIFEGRNRNAAGGKVPNPSWGKTAKAPRVNKSGKSKGPKVYGPTMSGQSDMLIGKRRQPRIIEAKTVGDAVREIARRNGFDGPFVLIEDCDDYVDGGRVVIPESKTDGQFLTSLAAEQPGGWTFKIDGDYLHFHSPHWSGGNLTVVDSLVYGAGPDILELTIDADFNLPLPRSIKVKSINPRTREVTIYDGDRNVMSNTANVSTAFDKGMDHPAREPQLHQDLIFASIATSVKALKRQAIDAFVARHMRAFQINLTCVGNPRLLAGRLLDLSGVGNPLVDGRWMIKEAKHKIISGSSLVYTTQVHLGPAPKAKQGTGSIRESTTLDAAKNMAQNVSTSGTQFNRGMDIAVGAVRKPRK